MATSLTDAWRGRKISKRLLKVVQDYVMHGARCSIIIFQISILPMT